MMPNSLHSLLVVLASASVLSNGAPAALSITACTTRAFPQSTLVVCSFGFKLFACFRPRHPVVVSPSQHIKSFLLTVKTNLRNMIRMVNVRSEILDNMETISDLSYAWEILNEFLPEMHARIKVHRHCGYDSCGVWW